MIGSVEKYLGGEGAETALRMAATLFLYQEMVRYQPLG